MSHRRRFSKTLAVPQPTAAGIDAGVIRRRGELAVAPSFISRAEGLPQHGRFFAFALAMYVLIVVARLHEAIPFLPPLYLGKLSAILLLAAAWRQLDRPMLSAVMHNKTARCVGAITILALLSVPGSFWPRESVGFLENEWLQGLLLFACVMAGFADPRTVYRVLICLTIASAVAAGQLLLGSGLIMGGRSYIGGASSTTYDPNETAVLFVMVLPYALLVASRRGKMRLVALAVIPMLLAALLKTGSRGGIVALAVLFVVLFVTGDRTRRVQCLVFAVVMMGIFTIVPHDDLVQRFGDLFGSGTDYNYDSRDGRMQIWKRGIGMMLDHPLLGVGVGSYEIANGVTAHSWLTAHNSLLEIGAELGVFGLVAFLAAIRYAAIGAWREAHRHSLSERLVDSSLERRHVAFAVLASLLAVLTAAFFLSMAYSALVLFALAAAAGLALRDGPHQATLSGGTASTVSGRGRLPGWRAMRRGPSAPKPETA